VAATPQRNGATVLTRLRANSDAGFSLVEVMVALVVFALIGAAVSALVVDSLHSTRASQSRVRAASLTAQEIEAVRAGLRSGVLGSTTNPTFAWSDPSCPASSATCVRVVDGQRFTLTRSVTPVAADATHGGRVLVTTTATWPNMNGVAPVVNSTVMTSRGITPGAAGSDTPGGGGSVAGGTSAVSVTVTGSSSVPYAYKPVTLAGPTGSLQTTTDATGVALFTGLAAATYRASATQAGYIDQAGNATVSAPVTTTANSTATVSLKYAQAATVTYTVSAPSGYTPGTTFPISVVNTDANTTKTVTPAASTGTTSVTTWPSNTVRAWNGTCSADQSTYTSFSATAGSTVAKTVGLSGLQVTLNKSLIGILGALLSSPISGAQLVAVKTADTGCPAGPVDPVSGTAVGTVVYFPTKTNSSGVAKVALPPGTWTIKAVGYSLGLTGGLLGWPNQTLTVDATGAGVTMSMTMNMGLV
jgi:prepilin-type N-terminal cleavage/methylation domain-containing protein